MGAVLATAEGTFDILFQVENQIDDLMREMDALLADSAFEECTDIGIEIFDLLRTRIHLRQFIQANTNDGSLPPIYEVG